MPHPDLAELLTQARGALGLTLREAARRMGISPAYLVALEQGCNPTTGRPPIPSPPVLAAIARVLRLEMTQLLGATGAPAPASAHVLLYRIGRSRQPVLAAARQACGGRVETWVELAGVRTQAGVTAAVAGRPRVRRVGLVFAGSSRRLRAAADPATV